MLPGRRPSSILLAVIVAFAAGLALSACGDTHPAQVSTAVVHLSAPPAPAPAVTLSFVTSVGRLYLRVPEDNATGHQLIGPGTRAIRPYRGTGPGVLTVKVARRGQLRIVISCVGGGKLTLENHADRVITSIRPCSESDIHRVVLQSAKLRSGTWRVLVKPRTRWSLAAISTTI